MIFEIEITINALFRTKKRKKERYSKKSECEKEKASIHDDHDDDGNTYHPYLVHDQQSVAKRCPKNRAMFHR